MDIIVLSHRDKVTFILFSRISLKPYFKGWCLDLMCRTICTSNSKKMVGAKMETHKAWSKGSHLSCSDCAQQSPKGT